MYIWENKKWDTTNQSGFSSIYPSHSICQICRYLNLIISFLLHFSWLTTAFQIKPTFYKLSLDSFTPIIFNLLRTPKSTFLYFFFKSFYFWILLLGTNFNHTKFFDLTSVFLPGCLQASIRLKPTMNYPSLTRHQWVVFLCTL